MYCKYCGKQITSITIECPYCHKRIIETASITNNNSINSIKNIDENSSGKPNDSNFEDSVYFTLCVVFFTFLVICLFVFLFSHGNHSNINNPKITSKTDTSINLISESTSEIDENKNKQKNYQQIYDKYSEMINSASSTNIISNILSEGTSEMTKYMLSSSGTDGQLSTCDKWIKKLNEVAQKANSLYGKSNSNYTSNYYNSSNISYNSDTENRSENKKIYYMNERKGAITSYGATKDTYALTVLNYQTEDYNSTVGEATLGQEWVIVSMQFENMSGSTVIIEKNDFRLVDGAERYGYRPWYKHLNTELESIEVRANQTVTFSVRFVYYKNREMSIRYKNSDIYPYGDAGYIDIKLR